MRSKCWGRAWLASDIPQTLVGGSAIVQLPCTGHPTHSTPELVRLQLVRIWWLDFVVGKLTHAVGKLACRRVDHKPQWGSSESTAEWSHGCYRTSISAPAIWQHYLLSHLYADNTQIYGACGPSDVSALLQKVTRCLTAVADWMMANRLQLNSDKTEFMRLTSP